MTIEPALFREITTLIKTERETYANVVVELIDNVEEVKNWLLIKNVYWRFCRARDWSHTFDGH